MRYLILALLAFVVTSCNSYNNCNKTCKDNTATDGSADVAQTEQVADQVADQVAADAPAHNKELITLALTEEATNLLRQLSNQFETVVKEKLNVTPLLTIASNPPNSVSTMITTPNALDIPAARDMVVKTAEMLVEIANNNPYIKQNSSKYPLTAADLDIIIDSNQSDSNVRSVSLIRGMIEYEALDPETNTYKIVKQEPFNHSQAKNNTTNCCGSYFVAKEKN